MKRNIFFIISALLAWVFGCMMILLPDSMASPTATGMNIGMQWFGIALFSIGVINFFARNDSGSKALTAVMIGNIFLHLAGGGADIYDYMQGTVQLSSILMPGIVHLLMIVGFVYFLFKKEDGHASSAKD
ncbi:MAG: hypothetical protein ACHQM6_01565 [Candidatus Kapaibacterium sp.]